MGNNGSSSDKGLKVTGRISSSVGSGVCRILDSDAGFCSGLDVDGIVEVVVVVTGDETVVEPWRRVLIKELKSGDILLVES